MFNLFKIFRRKSKVEREYIKVSKSKYIDKLKERGMTLVLLGFDNGLINFKLEGKINWRNHNGTITVLEEAGHVTSLETFEALCRYYLQNHKKYTNFVK